MRTIHKYTLEVTDRQTIQLPEGATVLHIAEQRDPDLGQADPSARTLQLWALVDTDHKPEERTFAIVGTGNPAPDEADPLYFVGTVLAWGGRLVWHVFEV